MQQEQSINTPRTPEDKSALLNVVQTFANHMATVILPYIGGSMAVFIAMVYLIYAFVLDPSYMSDALKNTITVVLVFAVGMFSFFYGVLMAALSTLRTVALNLEEFLKEFLGKVKDSFEKKVENMQDGIPKTQAKIFLNSSFKEVVKTYKDQKGSSVVKAVSIFILSFCVWVTRKVLFGKMKEAGGMEIGPSIIFAGWATLAGAVFFNLNLIATFLLFASYVFGLAVLFIPIFFTIII